MAVIITFRGETYPPGVYPEWAKEKARKGFQYLANLKGASK